MLVLTRKESEMVQIGDGIIVKVIQTGRGSIKIGIDAPAHVRVLRGEMSPELSKLSPTPQAGTRGGVPSHRSPAKEAACSEAI